jgi:response regulator RpfG family c-di-GMP phosphodiesterase
VREQALRFDGADGRPVKGPEIAIGARILAACSKLHAVLGTREIDAIAYSVANAALRAEAGATLDPAIVELLVAQPMASIRRIFDREAAR